MVELAFYCYAVAPPAWLKLPWTSAQVLPERPECRLASVNLVAVAEPTFHIARFLPSIRDSSAPLTFVWHVRRSFSPCVHPARSPPSVHLTLCAQ